ncbi:acyl-CoA carboxylase subunit beta [Thermodesulfobacteriota bacterium]
MDMEDKFEKINTWKMGMEWDVAVKEMISRKKAVKQKRDRKRFDPQNDRKKLTVMERIEKLTDKNSFFEAGSLMGRSKYDDEGDITDFTPDTFVTGVAEINGRPVTIGCDDLFTGCDNETGKGPDSFMQPMSIQYEIPAVCLFDGALADPGDNKEIDRMSLSDSSMKWWWYSQTLRKVPVAAAVMGPITEGAAVRACLSHFSVMVKGAGQIFAGGPQRVERMLGYKISGEELGGSWLHTGESGVIDNEAVDEEDCFDQIRQFISYMPDKVTETPSRKDMGDDPNRREEELLGIVPIQRMRPYDMHKLIRLIVDKGEFFEMRKGYGKSLITGFARMDGYVVGIVASNPNLMGGAVPGPAARKMARFVDLCNFFNIPVMLLVDVPGFDIGIDSEKQGTMRCGMHAVMAGAEANVPKVQINLRKAYGVASGAFNSVGGALNLSLRLGWPSGEWGPIPIEGGVAAAYRRDIASAPDPEARRKEIETKLVGVRSPFRAAEVGDVIDIIDPRDTRAIACKFIKLAQPSLKRNAALPKRSVRPW